MEHKIALLVTRDDCNLLKKCGDMISYLKSISDYLIINNVYCPELKINKIIGKNDETSSDENQAAKLLKHPFCGFLSSVICLLANISHCPC